MSNCQNCGLEFSDVPGFSVNPAVPFCGTYCEQEWWQDPFAGAMHAKLTEEWSKENS